jgi:short-subunit dehydrogenase
MEGKVIVITGASRGLGKALGQVLAEKKATVVISSRDRKEIEAMAKEIGATGIACDVTKEKDVIRIAEETVKKFGHIDIWINNAGVWLPHATIEETDMKRAHDVFEVNLFGLAYGSREAVIQMKKQGYGTIVNIISTSALKGRPKSTIYSASKHAAKGFTDSLREELNESGITVIGIYPGGIKTHLFDEKKPDEFGDFMTPEFVADKIVENLLKDNPDTDIILKRPGQK